MVDDLDAWLGGGITKIPTTAATTTITQNLTAIFQASNVGYCTSMAPSTSAPLGLSFMTAQAISRTRETTLFGSNAQGERPSTTPAPKTLNY